MSILWQIIARTLASHPRLVDWIIRRAQRTPYTHLTSADGSSVYMGRWWLFNPYDRDANNEQTPARIPWLPSVRIHHICRAEFLAAIDTATHQVKLSGGNVTVLKGDLQEVAA